MESILLDLRYGVRTLFRRPGFAILAILTLALGIGVNTAIFSVIHSVVLKPLPYPDPDSLVLIHAVNRQGRAIPVSVLDFQDIVRQSGAFQSGTLINPETYNLTGGGEPERVSGADVSASFFEVLGVPPVLGRGFRKDEENSGAQPVAVLSYGIWQRRFGGDAQVLGKTVDLNGNAYTIIGVAAAGFEFPSDVEVWRPLRFTPEQLQPDQRGARYLRAIGRLASGIAPEQARSRVEQIGAALSREYPDSNDRTGASLTVLRNFMVRNVHKGLWVLLGAVVFVLLIACANVANLLLVRAAQRDSEVAIRTALGAGRARLIRQFLVEGLLLAISAGMLGVLSAFWLTDLLRTFGPENLPRLQEVAVSPAVLMFTLGVSLLSGLVVGMIPALQTTARWSQALRSSGHRAIGGGTRTRALLVAGEIALALMLLAGAGLLIRSFARLQQVDPGFDPSGVYSFGISLPDARYSELHQSAAFYDELTARLAQRPGVKASAAIFGLPLSQGFTAVGSFERSDRPDAADEPVAGLRVITPDYFQVMGIAVRHGRAFQKSDDAEAPGVAVINEETAQRYWPGEDPIGKQLRTHISLVDQKSKPRTIVGVVGNVHFEGLEADPDPEIYIPHAQHPIGIMTVVMSVDSKAGPVETIIRSGVKSIDPDLPVWDLKSMDQIIGASIAERKFTMVLLAAFAGLALLLAAVGIYGVLSYAVVQRTREIGLRMAVGARQGDVMRLFLKEGSLVLTAGVLAGVLGALALTRVVASLLFGVPPTDVFTFVSVAFLLSSIAMAAGFVPALRASRVDPMDALRHE